GEEQLRRLVYPAGLDIGHASDEEIALSILAQILTIRANLARAAAQQPHQMLHPTAPVAEAVDPICDMVVAITPTALRADFEGTTYYFCGEGCRRRFLKDPATAVAATRSRSRSGSRAAGRSTSSSSRSARSTARRSRRSGPNVPRFSCAWSHLPIAQARSRFSPRIVPRAGRPSWPSSKSARSPRLARDDRER